MPVFFRPGGNWRRRRRLPPATKGLNVYSYTGSGGITLAGSAGECVALAYGPSGGITLSGTASICAAYAVVPGGGITLAGSAAECCTVAYAASGGLTLGGTAAECVVFAFAGSGGLNLGGSAEEQVAFAHEATGGLEFGGSAPVEFAPVSQRGGTARVIYVSRPKRTFEYRPQGSMRFRFGGTADAFPVNVRPYTGLVALPRFAGAALTEYHDPWLQARAEDEEWLLEELLA